jgi:serine/threonine protein phosphatase PrpC
MSHLNASEHVVKGEDAHFHFFKDGSHFFGVIDGHGGSKAAEMVRSKVEEVMIDLSDFPRNEEIILIFERLDRICQLLPCKSGCEMTLCILNQGNLVVANVGDCNCFVVTETSFYETTTSHRLQENSQERERLEGNVGFVKENGKAVGPPRLFPGGLSCSRSLGDFDCPKSISIPSISRTVITSSDIVVVATDGIWDFLSKKEVFRSCRKFKNAALITEMVKKKMCADDATIVVLSGESPSYPSPSKFKTLLWPSSGGSSSSLSSEEDRTVVQVPL